MSGKKIDGLGTTGQAYHHLRQLAAVGWLHSTGRGRYEVPPHREDYAGLVLSLARQEHPDMSAYDDPEIVQRIDMPQHAGLIVCSPSSGVVQERLESYSRRFLQDYYASAPAPDTATH